MKRSLQLERVFNLGDYKSIRFGDVIEELPADIIFDNTIVDKIRFLQMLNADISFQVYKKLNAEILKREAKGENVLEYLETLKISTMEEIKNLLNGHLKE